MWIICFVKRYGLVFAPSPGRSQEIDLRAGAICINIQLRAPGELEKSFTAWGFVLPGFYAGKNPFLPDPSRLGILTPLFEILAFKK